VLLAGVLDALADGQAVSVQRLRTTLSTQEAADILGVSRPTVVRLIDKGEIDCTTTGTHRRVQLDDVLAYQDRIRRRRTQALDQTAAESVPKKPGAGVGFIETR
jgi:excisionase family DNA binding protein